MPHHVYIDNDIYLDIDKKSCFKHTTTGGIKAIFILLGKLDLMLCQGPIFWDSLLDMAIVPANCTLGRTIDTHHLTIGTPPNFIAEVTTLLHTMWGPHRQLFHVHEAKVLTCKPTHIGFSSPWVTLLLGHIYSSLASILHMYHAHLFHTSNAIHMAIKSIQPAAVTPADNMHFP